MLSLFLYTLLKTTSAHKCGNNNVLSTVQHYRKLQVPLMTFNVQHQHLPVLNQSPKHPTVTSLRRYQSITKNVTLLNTIYFVIKNTYIIFSIQYIHNS